MRSTHRMPLADRTPSETCAVSTDVHVYGSAGIQEHALAFAGEANLEERAAFAALDCYRPAVIEHDATHCREADAAALSLGRIAGFEQSRLNLAADAGPAVAYGQNHERALSGASGFG